MSIHFNVLENLDDLEDVVDVEFNLTIVEDTLRKIEPNISDDQIQKIWSQCNGNPHNASIIYKLNTLS